MIDQLTTNSNGYTDINDVQQIEGDVDSYTLYCKETSAPAGYIFD